VPEVALDGECAVRWLQQAIRTPSVTGAEGAFARLVADELRALGADEVHLEEVDAGRPIVWSISRGAGGGPSLLLSGHLDTVRVDGWRERWRGDEREDPFGAAIVEGAVWGRGAADVKAGIAASLAALRTLHDSGTALAGDVVTAWVCDEESGESGSGRSLGMRAVCDRIVAGVIPRTDFAIYVEPTRLRVFTAQIGFLISEIEIVGRSAYFGRPEDGVDALRAGHRVLSDLWRLGDGLPARGKHPLVGQPRLLVTGFDAGGYIAVPGSCRLSLIRSLIPGEDLDRAAAEIERIAVDAGAAAGCDVAVSFPAGRDHPYGGLPAETQNNLEPVERLLTCIRECRPDAAGVAGAPFWAEMSFLVAAGIPCVYWAPGDIANCHTAEERVGVDEFLDGVRMLSQFIAGHCGAGPTEGGGQ
jgi:acetylornithine deacetylase